MLDPAGYFFEVGIRNYCTRDDRRPAMMTRRQLPKRIEGSVCLGFAEEAIGSERSNSKSLGQEMAMVSRIAKEQL